MVTIRSCSAAKACTSSVSSGFTKRMLATVASITSPAWRAGASMEPKARRAIRLPRRLTSPLPIASPRKGLVTEAPGPLPTRELPDLTALADTVDELVPA